MGTKSEISKLGIIEIKREKGNKNSPLLSILKDKMNAGGIFIIEDVDCLDEKRDEFIKLHSNCEIIDNRSLLKRYDDVLIVYRF